MGRSCENFWWTGIDCASDTGLDPESESQRRPTVQRRSPLGQQIFATLVSSGSEAAARIAREAGQPDLFERVNAVASEAPAPSFLHSALCAMSLPVRRPADDQAPIIRQDGQYTLVITPKPVVARIDGQQRLTVLGVPYGSLPRLVLIHIMTEAVRSKSRHVVLGGSFTEWMRRMGFRTISYGPRGSATLIRQQLDRLLACEWMIRWESDPVQGEKEFGIKEIKITNEYVGRGPQGRQLRRAKSISTEGFYEHLRRPCRAAGRACHPPVARLGDRARPLHLARLPAAARQPEAAGQPELGPACRAFRQRLFSDNQDGLGVNQDGDAGADWRLGVALP